MKALDRMGWPIRERDVVLLENEIRQGESYIKQAADLIKQTRGKEEDDEDDKISVASSGESTDAEVSDSDSHRHSRASPHRSGKVSFSMDRKQSKDEKQSDEDSEKCSKGSRDEKGDEDKENDGR